MKQSKLFRTLREGENEDGLPEECERVSGKKQGTEMCADTSSVAQAVRGWREKCSTWYLLLISCYFELLSLGDKFALPDSDSIGFEKTERKVLCHNEDVNLGELGMAEFNIYTCIYVC